MLIQIIIVNVDHIVCHHFLLKIELILVNNIVLLVLLTKEHNNVSKYVQLIIMLMIKYVININVQSPLLHSMLMTKIISVKLHVQKELMQIHQQENVSKYAQSNYKCTLIKIIISAQIYVHPILMLIIQLEDVYKSVLKFLLYMLNKSEEYVSKNVYLINLQIIKQDHA